MNDKITPEIAKEIAEKVKNQEIDKPVDSGIKDLIKDLNIYERLLKITNEIGILQKESKDVNGQWAFLSHEAVSEACNKAFVINRIYAQPKMINHGIERIGNNALCTVEIEYTFINVDKPEERVVVNGFGQGMDSRDKAYGMAISYASKYALKEAFRISSGDDPERNLGNKPLSKPKPQKTQKMYASQIAKIEDLITKTALVDGSYSVARICAGYQVNKLQDIESNKYSQIVNKLQGVIGV